MSDVSRSNEQVGVQGPNSHEIPEVIPAGSAHLVGINGTSDPTQQSASPSDGDDESDVLSPAKVIRIGAMLKQLLEEVRNTPIDEAARGQLGAIYTSSITELKSFDVLGEKLFKDSIGNFCSCLSVRNFQVG